MSTSTFSLQKDFELEELCNSFSKHKIENFTINELQKIALYQKDRIEEQKKEIRYLQNSYRKLSLKQNVFENIEIPNFVAIDFETATPDRMACQLGIVVVNDYKITEELRFYIQPPNNTYHFHNMANNFVKPTDTEFSPTFLELWPTIKHYFENQYIVAHNTTFDIGVLLVNCSYYNIPEPKLNNIICTCEMHNMTNLVDACGFYGLSINKHHDALEDARACALLLIKYMELSQVISCKKKIISKESDKNLIFKSKERTLSSAAKQQDLTNVVDKDNFFYNKKVVISGTFKSFEMREDLALKLKGLGADINTSISKKTNIFIYGEDFGPVKMNKVNELINNGTDITLINEENLLKLLNT